MEKDDYWNVFLKTGSAMDYLQYAVAKESECKSLTTERNSSSQYGEPDNSYGDGITGSTSGRLR